MGATRYDDPRITAFGLLAEVYAGLSGVLSEQLAEHGLSLVEFEVLVRLARSPQRQLRMTELAGQVALTTSGITRVVDRLERRELVCRQACPNDRRGAWAVLTAAGEERLAAALPEHVALLERHFTGRFSPAELTLLTTRLRQIRDEVHPGGMPGKSNSSPAAPSEEAPTVPAPELAATAPEQSRSELPDPAA
ncbi:MAG TPA: MarR family transcriptional regulator [Natronosporangium sp.]|nr:MarR family transcriptional regulator [Natronosporangium sp.]